MKNFGIWLDKEKAHLVTITNNQEKFETINSNLEMYRIHGGAGSRFKGGPQDVVQDSKYLEREKNQLKAYFKELVTSLKEADNLAIFGPAEVPKKFKKELENNYKELNAKVKTVKTVDSMTNNQLIVLVRDYFNQ